MWLTDSGFGALCICGLDANFNCLRLVDIPQGRLRFLCCSDNIILLELSFFHFLFWKTNCFMTMLIP